jgi:hypothetical protein
MKRIQLTEEQQKRLDFLAKEVAPHFGTMLGHGYGLDHWYVMNWIDEEEIPWLEFCFTHLVDLAAHRYIDAHIDCTLSWAIRMIAQKLVHEMNKINPIDTLYELCIHPEDYKQTL